MCNSHESLNLKITQMQKESDIARVQINNRLDKIDWNISSISESLNWFILKVETKFLTKDSAKSQFATKLTEKIVYAAAWMILMGVFSWLIYLVINK